MILACPRREDDYSGVGLGISGKMGVKDTRWPGRAGQQLVAALMVRDTG